MAWTVDEMKKNRKYDVHFKAHKAHWGRIRVRVRVRIRVRAGLGSVGGELISTHTCMQCRVVRRAV